MLVVILRHDRNFVTIGWYNCYLCGWVVTVRHLMLTVGMGRKYGELSILTR